MLLLNNLFFVATTHKILCKRSDKQCTYTIISLHSAIYTYVEGGVAEIDATTGSMPERVVPSLIPDKAGFINTGTRGFIGVEAVGCFVLKL